MIVSRPPLRWLPGRLLTLAFAAILLAVPVPTATAAHRLAHRPPPPMPARAGATSSGGNALPAAMDASSAAMRYGGLHVRQGPSGAEVAMSIRVAGAVGPSVARLGSFATILRARAGTIEAYVPLRSLASLVALPGVTSAEPIRSPVLDAFVNQGVGAIGADGWQAAGFDGTGVKVGVIDGGFQGYSARGAAMPKPAGSRCYSDIGTLSTSFAACETSTSHGTDVLETLAAVAPGASFFVSNAEDGSWNDIADTIDWMARSGVRIINASWGSVLFEGPGDGTSPHVDSIYALVDRAISGGALWVASAGNYGTLGWSGAWRDENANGWLEFANGSEDDRIDLEAGDHLQVAIRWPGRWGTADSTAYEVGIYPADPTAKPYTTSFDFPQECRLDPCGWIPDFVAPATGSYYIAVYRHGAPVSSIQLLVGTQAAAQLEFHTPAGTLADPADGTNPGMIAVGAVNVGSPSVVEDYSSRGPTADGRIRPDVVAPDCAALSDGAEFCGTSEAAPLVSGAAALALEADPSLRTPASLASWLRAHVAPLGTPVPNPLSGYGLVALGAPPAPVFVPAAVAFGWTPRAMVAALSLPAPITVRIVDGDGQPVRAGPGASAPVTLALDPTSPAGALTCAGGATVSAVAGVASFTGCTIDQDGTGFVLTATSGALTAASSAPIDVLPAGTPVPGLAVHASAPAITWGQAVTFAATLTTAGGSAESRTVRLETSADGVTWSSAVSATSDAAGRATFAYRPPANAWYRIAFDGAPDLGPAVSAADRVVVRQVALLRPMPSSVPIVVGRGTRVVLTTTIRPSRADLPVPSATYEIYRLSGTSWRLAGRMTIVADAAGLARLTWTFGSAGSWYVRSSAVPTPMNANSTWSAAVRYTVR